MNLRILSAICLIAAAVHGLAWGQFDLDPRDFGSEEITEPTKGTPLSFETHVDAIGKAKITNGKFRKGDAVQFDEANVELGMMVYYCPAFEEGLRLSLAYTATYLKQERNPWFTQDHFNIVTLNIGGLTRRLDDWFWRAALDINIDADMWQAGYTYYDLLFWGRYDFREDIGIHIGFWAETGMNLNRIWPIIGADWQISKQWKLNLVYPVNVSLEYALTRNWSLALAGRNFNSRFRAHDQTWHRAKTLIRYTNIGAEFMIKYNGSGISANIHAGSTFAGRYRLADRDNHHPETSLLKPSGYIGGEIDVRF